MKAKIHLCSALLIACFFSTHAVAGESVTPLKPQGNVIIQSGGKLEIYNADSVILDKGFEVKLGGELNIY